MINNWIVVGSGTLITHKKGQKKTRRESRQLNDI